MNQPDANLVLETFRHAIAVFGSGGRLVMANRRFAELLSLPPALSEPGIGLDEIVRHNWRKGLYGDVDEAAAIVEWRLLSEDGKDRDLELRRPSGQVLRLEKTALPQGGFTLAYFDISDLKETEAKLRASETRLRAILEDQSEMISRFDKDFRLTFVNGAYCAGFGKSESRLIGSSFLDSMLEGPQRDRFVEALGKLTKEQPTLIGEYPEIGADGSVSWHHWTDRAIFDEAGEIVEFQAVGRDVTREREVQEALEKSEQHFKSIAEAHPVPVLILDLDQDVVLHASPAAAPLLGPDHQAIIAQKPRDFFADARECSRFLEALDRNGAVDAFKLDMRAADHRVMPAEVTARRVEYNEHEAVALGVVDVSERMRAQEEIAQQREALAQSEKMSAMGSLLASVSHELNNPISIILAQGELLQALSSDAGVLRKAERIRLAAGRCSRIVKTFLALARHKAPSRGDVSINELVHKALDLVGYSLSTSGIEVHLDLDHELPIVQADGDQLMQVFTNLLVNAQQALMDQAPPRQIRIASRVSASSVRIELADSGPGISPELRESVFEPFFTTKPEGLGTGIGLAVCRGIIEAHEGTIEIADRKDAGAVFAVTLPIAETAGKKAVDGFEARLSWAALSPLSILVVDDEEDIAKSIEEILAASGHRVRLAANGLEALAMLEGGDYDLIVSDLRMPSLDGPGLYRAIRERGLQPTHGIGFMTGDTLSGAMRRFLAEAGRPTLEKPFEPDELRDLVLRVVDTGSPRGA